MIHYDLECDRGHGFDSWFQSADAFDRLSGQGMVACARCGSPKVKRALMAPALRKPREAVPVAAGPAAAKLGPPRLSRPEGDLEEALAELRRQIEENSEYVGLNFAAEARAIHEGDAPERAIYGEARRDEARALIEDGVPVAPLPFLPTRRAN
ncbi:MAG: DUF1178 family protein [Paracoccaceae bacterium]